MTHQLHKESFIMSKKHPSYLKTIIGKLRLRRITKKYLFKFVEKSTNPEDDGC